MDNSILFGLCCPESFFKNLPSSNLCLQTNNWHMVCNVHTQARGCTFNWSSGATQRRAAPPPFQHDQTISVNGVQQKRHRLCQNLWENCHLCSPAVCALILQSASTSAVQKHTLAWNCYKANCSLSETLFDHAVCLRGHKCVGLV